MTCIEQCMSNWAKVYTQDVTIYNLSLSNDFKMNVFMVQDQLLLSFFIVFRNQHWKTNKYIFCMPRHFLNCGICLLRVNHEGARDSKQTHSAGGRGAWRWLAARPLCLFLVDLWQRALVRSTRLTLQHALMFNSWASAGYLHRHYMWGRSRKPFLLLTLLITLRA